MQNFNDILNGVSDGTKDLSISALTVAGTATLNGAVNLGNATGDDITVTGYISSALTPKTTVNYDLGTSSLFWSNFYIGHIFAKVNDGTIYDEGDPPYSFTGDTNTGIYSEGADQLNLVTGGTSRVDISTSKFQCNLPIDVFTADALDTDAAVVVKSLSASGTGRQSRFQILDDAGTSQWSIQYDNSSSTSLTMTTVTGLTLDTAAGGITHKRSATTGSNTYWTYQDGSGTTTGTIVVDADANTTAYNTSSDGRLKTNISDFDGLALIKQMNPVAYERKSKRGSIELGLIAQDMNQIYPNSVHVGGEDPDFDPWQLDYSKLVGILVKANKQLLDRLEKLETKLLA